MRMRYLARYRAGAHAEVWDELAALGPAVRDPAVLDDARAVVRATMERVATNVERLIGRLASHSYEFGVYPDGTKVPGVPGPLVRPDAALLGDIDELERLAGAVPLSLRGFWEVVGSVSLVGRTGRGWPEYSDPLWVDPPKGGIIEFHDWRAEVEEHGSTASRPFLCPIAPDVLHKDAVSGGPPYGLRLPDAGADATVRDEWHNVGFVGYLRIAILDWGGFPGLSPVNPFDSWRGKDPWRPKDQILAPPDWIEELTHDLVAF